MNTAILGPIIGLVAWSFVMWAWLYATRIPAMIRLKMRYDPAQPNAVFTGAFPPQVRWKADNYNHLMEQPTLFYALAIYTYLAGHEGALTCAFAWSYVGLRVAHSLVQGTVNVVPARFLIFALASLVLMAWAVREAAALLLG